MVKLSLCSFIRDATGVYQALLSAWGQVCVCLPYLFKTVSYTELTYLA